MREERKTALRPRIQHKYAKIKLWFSPLALPTGENPGQFAPWRFVSLAHFIQDRLIDRILAHFGGFSFDSGVAQNIMYQEV